MSNEKIITVITTVFNKAPYLETWAISVASQTYLHKARILVIDDGSTDGSLELVKQYAATYNIPVELIVHEKNCGLTQTIIEAYSMLDTKYFTVLDADDYWLSSQKLEKAINFLETHPDYSAYTSNYFQEYKDGNMVPQRPVESPAFTFCSMKGTPHFQTVAITFRNFFTPKILDSMENFTEKYLHKYFNNGCNSDSLRNYFAFNFGKCYFENSLDGVFRCDIGFSGSLPELAGYVGCMRGHLDIFELYNANFGLDDNSMQALTISADYYKRSVNLLAEMMLNMRISNFEVSDYFRRGYGGEFADKSAAEIVLNVLLDYGNRLREMGFSIK